MVCGHIIYLAQHPFDMPTLSEGYTIFLEVT